MTITLLTRLCIVALIALVVATFADKIQALDAGTQFALLLLGGGASAILIASWVAPWMGDKAGTIVYSSGEVLHPGDMTPAVTKLEQGDYEGAIAECAALLRDNPDDTQAMIEIASIRAHKLHDALGAITFLQEQLDARKQLGESAAPLMFLIVDIRLELLHDATGARHVLEQIIERFPDTPHSAHAHHRLHEIEQAAARKA
jgi:hypothetical protein